ncbi:hypothetical protein [Ammoniphilus sp. CFH 90114]|uniref:hypothetical protein n=1 Tax=Ammoniphilus sp. CFH 90114 TaxID=2493665 RepID=UPI00100ED916|nr:hypothetical protein [Ammoniphilus sp. CFH 90114]RXT07935.1 hypothetical protein EIZ39_10995 [Ammoniphilus sp. CFH 90114]
MMEIMTIFMKMLQPRIKSIKARAVTVKVPKAFLLNIPSAQGYLRGPVEKNEKLNVIGQSGSFWFIKGSTGHGFISKTVAW